MNGRNSLVNFLATIFFILTFALLAACSQVQNLTVTPETSSCVQPNMYCPNDTPGCINESLAIANFPVIAKNPQHAPYCMSFTITNPNSPSTDGSNMQVTYPGLVLSGFPNESATAFAMMDPVASGESDAVTNQTQITGNIALFDPNNCATIGGANTITLQGGQSCTFYLQIVNEAYPPNTYPISLQYTSYNGNVSNTIATNIYEHVILYGGTNSGLYENQTSGTVPAQWLNNAINAPAGKTGSIIVDSYGNLYFANGTQVYMYNGLHLINLGNPFVTQVNSLTFDVNGNLYAGTNGSGLYIYNTSETPNAWTSFTDTSGNLNSSSIIAGVSSTGFLPNAGNQNLYVTTINQAYKCSIATSNSITTSCAFTNISSQSGSPTTFNADVLAADDYGLYLGSNTNAFSYIESQNAWQQFTFPGNTITGNVSGIFHQTLATIPYTYVGIANATNANESAIYNCNADFSCSPVIHAGSPTVNATGNVHAVTVDGDGDLFIGGNNLNSSDFASTPNVNGAYLYYSSNSTNPWQSIANGSLPANSTISSMAIGSYLNGQ